MTIVKVLAEVLGILTIGLTILPIVRSETWWVRIWDFPKLQMMGLGIISLMFLTLTDSNSLFEKILCVLILSNILFLAFKIFPYTVFSKNQVFLAENNQKDHTISVLITNVYMENKNVKKCLDIITKVSPDIILAVETNNRWQKGLKVLEEEYPFHIQVPLENTYGMMFFSKYKIIESEVRYIFCKDVPSVKAIIELNSGVRILFYGLHPKPPAPNESKSTLKRDAELIVIAKEARNQNLPVIVAGDLNDVAWSDTTHLFQKISGLLDPRIGRGMYSTFNAKYPLLRWPLDHVFHSTHFKLVQLERQPHIESDHFPIFVKLSYEPDGNNEQISPEPTPEDLEESKKKVKRANKLNLRKPFKLGNFAFPWKKKS